jgi:hypothetical protein
MTDIIKLYKDFIRKKATSGGRRPGLHVSDLNPDCLRKSYYRMNDTQIREFDDNTIDNFFYGTAVHNAFDGIVPIMEYQMCVNPFDEIIEDEIVDINKEMKDNPFKWVSGSADAIINDEVILDFKTCTKLPSHNHVSYMKQINFYSYMYYLYTGIEIKKGANLFLEKTSGFHKIKLFEFDLNSIDINREAMMYIMDIISQEEPP